MPSAIEPMWPETMNKQKVATWSCPQKFSIVRSCFLWIAIKNPKAFSYQNLFSDIHKIVVHFSLLEKSFLYVRYTYLLHFINNLPYITIIYNSFKFYRESLIFSNSSNSLPRCHLSNMSSSRSCWSLVNCSPHSYPSRSSFNSVISLEGRKLESSSFVDMLSSSAPH
jgi:hypothetical protein